MHVECHSSISEPSSNNLPTHHIELARNSCSGRASTKVFFPGGVGVPAAISAVFERLFVELHNKLMKGNFVMITHLYFLPAQNLAPHTSPSIAPCYLCSSYTPALRESDHTPSLSRPRVTESSSPLSVCRCSNSSFTTTSLSSIIVHSSPHKVTSALQALITVQTFSSMR